MEDPRAAALADASLRLRALYGDRLRRLLLYGSEARQEAASDSDLDVLVVLEGDVRPADEIRRTGEIAAALSLEHHRLVSLAFVSEERFLRESSPFLMNVRREGVPV